VLFLAEAVHPPARLFGWPRWASPELHLLHLAHGKQELTEFALMHAERADECRPNLFVNTPDILHESLQTGGPSMFAIRATLAATMSPTYGRVRRLRALRVRSRSGRAARSTRTRRSTRCARATSRRPLNEGRSLEPYLTRLNEIRRAPPALQQLRDIHFHHTDNDQVIAYSKTDVKTGDTVLVVCTLDPDNVQTANLALDMPSLGADWDDTLVVHDEIGGATFHWGQFAFARLEPWRAVAHILTVTRRPPDRPRTTRGATAVPHDVRWADARWARLPATVRIHSTRRTAEMTGATNVTAARAGRAVLRRRQVVESTSDDYGQARTLGVDHDWFKRAVFYEVLVRAFADSNRDGTGDLRGLTEKLDYIQWLGVDCIWLPPFYDSPLRDGGYDIRDFRAVLPSSAPSTTSWCSSTRRTSAASA
jgi:hypothetical protein